MKKSVSARLVALTAALATVALPTVAITAVSSPAHAAVNDPVVSGVNSPMWQTDNSVEAIATSNGVVYAGGTFLNVRPPGAAAGSQQTRRTYLAAFNASTGALVTGFNVTLNGAVEDMAVSPNGSLLYIVGRFTTVNGTARSRVAAINLPSGTLATGFTANANATVTAVDANASAVYVGGDFTSITNGAATPKSRFASLNPTTGQPNAGFTASLDARPYTIEIAPDNSRVLVGGNFTTVNGAATQGNGTPNAGIASVSPTSGAVQAWNASNTQPVNTACVGRVTDIVTQGSTAYVTAEGDLPGCYEGTYAASISNGTLAWNSSCLGASQGVTVLGSVLYRADHQHDCAYNLGDALGGFVGGTYRDRFIHKYLTGQNISDGTFVHWSPALNASGAGGVGPHTIANDGSRLFVGGDFTRVNGAAQQGLTRFASTGTRATPRTPGANVMSDPYPGSATQVASNLAISALPTRAGTLTVEFPAVEDYDSGTLTYRIYRDNGTTPVNTQTVESYPWSRPVLRFDDTGLVAGSTHSYQVTASDGTNTSARSTAVSGTVASSAPPSLASAYTALAPQLWWRLSDTGPTAADSATGAAHPGTFQGGVTKGQAGPGTGNTAVTLDGSSGYVNSTSTVADPTAFSESAWFRTTTIRGGVIMAQSSIASGAGGNSDRVIVMDNNGGLVFAMKSPPNAGAPPIFGTVAVAIRNQGPIWNDGKWHHVVGAYDGTTASLYVDGKLQGSTTGTPFDPTAKATGMPTSYQRAGYADLSQMQLVFGINFYNRKWPASEHFAGSIDEVTAFNKALTATQARSMFAAGVGGGA